MEEKKEITFTMGIADEDGNTKTWEEIVNVDDLNDDQDEDDGVKIIETKAYTELKEKLINDAYKKLEKKRAKKVKELSKLEPSSEEYLKQINLSLQLFAKDKEKLEAQVRELENAHFKELSGNAEAILEDAKEQTKQTIKRLYNDMNPFDVSNLAEDGDEIGKAFLEGYYEKKVPVDKALENVRQDTKRHREELEKINASVKLAELDKFISDYFLNCDYVALEKIELNVVEPIHDYIEPVQPSIKRPITLFNSKVGVPNDKVINQLISEEPTDKLKDYFKSISGQSMAVYGVNQGFNPKNKNKYKTNKNKQDKIPVFVGIANNNEELKKLFVNNEFDIFVVVSTLIYNNYIETGVAELYISAEDIWRNLRQGKQRSSVSEEQVQQVVSFINKHRGTTIYMDITKEKIKGVSEETKKKYFLGKNLLEVEDLLEYDEKTGKQRVIYHFKALPSLFEYNLMKNHVLWIPAKVFNVANCISITDNVTEFTRYLATQIVQMYNGYRNSTKIYYETLYHDAGILAPAQRVNKEKYNNEKTYLATIRREAKADREKIEKILTYWANMKDEKGKPLLENGKPLKFIDGFRPIKKGNAFLGIEIILNKDQKQKMVTYKD